MHLSCVNSDSLAEGMDHWRGRKNKTPRVVGEGIVVNRTRVRRWSVCVVLRCGTEAWHTTHSGYCSNQGSEFLWFVQRVPWDGPALTDRSRSERGVLVFWTYPWTHFPHQWAKNCRPGLNAERAAQSHEPSSAERRTKRAHPCIAKWIQGHTFPIITTL